MRSQIFTPKQRLGDELQMVLQQEDVKVLKDISEAFDKYFYQGINHSLIPNVKLAMNLGITRYINKPYPTPVHLFKNRMKTNQKQCMTTWKSNHGWWRQTAQTNLAQRIKQGCETGRAQFFPLRTKETAAVHIAQLTWPSLVAQNNLFKFLIWL